MKFITVLLFLFTAGTAQAQHMLEQEGMRYYQEGNYQSAIETLERVTEQDPMRMRAQLILVSSYLQFGDVAMAEDKSRQAMDLFPQTGAFRWLLAESLLQQQKFEEALVHYKEVDKALKQGESLNPMQVRQDRVEARIGKVHQSIAAQAYQNNQPEKALREMEQAVKNLSDSLQAHKNYAMLLMEEERYERTIEVIDQVQMKFPEDAGLIKMKASAYYQKEDREAVLEQFEKLYSLNPNDVDNGLIYAELLMSNRQSKEAVTVLEELLEKHPNEKKIYRSMADLNERRFNMKGKRAVLRKMENKFPKDRQISGEIAETFEMEEKWQQARAVYDSLATETGHELQYRMASANTYSQQDSLEEAGEIYRSLQSNYPVDPTLLSRLGENLEAREKWEEAVDVYERLLPLSKESDTEVKVRLGVAKMNAGDHRQATEHLQNAIGEGSNNPEAYLALSQLKEQDSQEDEAFELAEEALRRSLRVLSEQQQTIEAQVQQEGIQSQAGNKEQIGEFKEINRIAEKSFGWLTETFDQNRVEPVMLDLLEEYNTSGRLHYMSGIYYSNQGEIQKALDQLEESIQFSPKLAEAHVALARILEDQNQTEKAIKAYERAVSLEPENSNTYSALIRTYDDAGKLELLCNRWLAQHRANMDNEVLKKHLVEALHKADRFEDAKAILNQ
ncbi:MAG: tetratricopeptide repeat protein [Balneolaceae bacterium]|nr:tetratricopeptide repeat protein [Balneolaceae bacterium]